MTRRAIIMDRDGTLCDEVGYLDSVNDLSISDANIETVSKAVRAGYLTVVVTNQSGVARGMFDEETVQAIHDKIQALLEAGGGRVDRFYYCPHHPDAGRGRYRTECDCRKPKPGMLLRARDELGLDLERSYMIGDSMRDIEAGRAAGATTILVLTGYGKQESRRIRDEDGVSPDHVADDLASAVDWIQEKEEDRK